MKRILVYIAVLSVIPTFAMAKANNSRVAQNDVVVRQAETAEPTETREPGKTPEIRSGETSEPAKTQEPTETPEIRKTETPDSNSSNDNQEIGKSDESQGISKAVNDLLDLAKELDDRGIGNEVSLIAKAQEDNQSGIDDHISKAQRRSNFAKFFIGANFKELKEAKQLIAQNIIKIDELKRIMLKITNQSDKDAITAQIIILEEQNKSLENKVDQLASGFSLFGWLNKIVNKY